MGYALFTARKLSVTTRLNNCNANLMSITEKEYALTASIFAKQNASALDSTKASQEAYAKYETAMNGLAGMDSSTDEYKTAKTNAETALNKAIADIDVKSAMSDAEIQTLNQQQTMYDLQKKNLETQLNAYQNELDAVEKAEENAIKGSTPKF